MERTTAISGRVLHSPLRIVSLFLLLQLLLVIAANAQTAPIRVSGTVKDAKGSPLHGVSVSVKGTTSGVTTDSTGKYSISVPGPQSTLVFSLISYSGKQETVGARTSINVTLVEGGSNLDDVIVIGYGGAVKKRDLTGAISSVSSKQIQERQPVTLFDALQGQAAGVLVTNDNGDPAGQGTIQIRGASTVNSGNGPLYVIDGIISENGNFVNPNDVESIEVLKDASSTSIYGARGANGVILITTKKGKVGKPMISASYLNVFGQLAHKLRTTSADELRYYRAARGDGNAGANVDSLNPYLNADNDFQDLMFRTGNKKVASLSVGGGQQGIQYYGSLNYTDDQSIVINSWIKRVQSKINLTYQASPKLRITHSLAFAWQTGNNIPVGTSVKVVFDRNPWTSIFRPDGSYTNYVESKRNPIAQALFVKDRDNNYTTQFSTQVMYEICKDLKFTALFNAQLDNNSNNYFSPASLTSGGTGDANGSNSFDKRIYWEAQAFLNYTKTLKGKHTFTGLLGVSTDRRRSDNYLISMQGYLSEAINTSNAGALLISGGKTYTGASANADASAFARAGYSYMGKYIVQGTWRHDGSSRFGQKSKWGDFFSGSAAWRFSDEKFMDWTRGVLSDGKLRFSVGQAGNDRIADYASYTVLNFGLQYYNGNYTAAESSTLGNSTIKWETTTTFDYGIDLSFFRGRMTFTADYYRKVTDNLLYNKELPKETGKSQVTVNLGTIVNTGLEFTLGGTPIATKNFTWDLTGNISFQRGYIKTLANHTSFISGNKWLIREGGKIGDFFLWDNLGVYQYDASNAYDVNGTRLEPINVTAAGTTSDYLLNGAKYTGTVYSKSRNGIKLQGGDTEWRDVNNDGIIDDKDKVIAGNGIPDFYFGITNNIRYKNFTFSFLVNGQIGNDIYNSVANGQNTFSSTYSPPIWDAIITSWKKQGDITKYPYFPRKDTRGSISNGYNSLYIEDGSFIRLSSARLTYMLKSDIASKIKMKSASVYVYGSNILTWTDYTWYDPEFSSTGLNIGEDNGKYPKRREVGIGATLNF